MNSHRHLTEPASLPGTAGPPVQLAREQGQGFSLQWPAQGSGLLPGETPLMVVHSDDCLFSEGSLGHELQFSRRKAVDPDGAAL